ncbi:MAG TPA: hypothetical protein VN179_05940 [Solirubrobacterales bacterium]|nr:hypothetical protein [Solirubrobacterales bacterium]
MPKDPEIIVEEIAQSVGGEIKVFEDPETGECHVSIETEHGGYATGSGPTRTAAHESLIEAAEDVGWEPPKPVT